MRKNRYKSVQETTLRTPLPAPALRQARLHLLEYGACPATGVDERVARSWQRSLKAGLLPTDRLAETEHASAYDLRQALACNNDLLLQSQPLMDYLFEQVRDSHSMVVLADQHGTLINTLGDGVFLGKAERVALTSGASWHEQYRGTNAIGTALADASSVKIHATEHFLERNSFLTCAAAPILSAQGVLMGIIDISGDQHSGHVHTLGLVNTAASMIENRLLIATCRRSIRLHLHAQPEGLGTVAEGIVVLSDDGWIVGANRRGLALLNMTPLHLGVTLLANLMDIRLEDLLSRHQRRPGQVMQVTLRGGRRLFVQVHAGQTALRSTRALPRSVLEAGNQPDALARLDSGDLRWRRAAGQARRVVGKPIPLLILGESGVGKELFARAAHDSGPRRAAPFVAINCAALPEHLMEAELFGYTAGAFTGARREGSLGHLRAAQGGTLFLDEIGDMPLAMQSSLLRVLQERQVTPLGGGLPAAVDFSLICATNRKLREEAESGRFRSDLYYRINGLTVQLPALRERTDFGVLTASLLASLNPTRVVSLAPDLMAQLSRYAWPGNLRQYANMLRTASALLDLHENCIDWSHLPDDMIEALAAKSPALTSVGAPERSQRLKDLSRLAIRQALDSSCGNISQAARRLGISRQTLYRWLQD
ncbi:MAG: transcriptional regulator of acetoin/glycerol metabolism [Rhodoferax sp.]|jgi:transcriptional regulator of acetoin/glycerol metabolism